MAPDEDVEQLILRAGLGDRAAFGRLYQATSAKLFGLCLRVLKDGAEAEDALQEAYVKIWHNAGRYAQNGMDPMAWLVTVTRNAAIDRLRRRRESAVEAQVYEARPDPSPGPEDAAAAASERRRIDACLAELEADRAGAVRAAYLDGATYDDLAARYGVPLNTMRTWLRRSLIRLRECLTR